MTQEEKQLLLVDLCARLPYGVMCQVRTRFVFEDGTLRRGTYDKILDLDTVTEIHDWSLNDELEKIKPYLRPMSSMTDEEESRYNLIQGLSHWTADDGKIGNYAEAIDWLNAYHFDYRGLIEKGLAFEAPKDMYNTKIE